MRPLEIAFVALMAAGAICVLAAGSRGRIVFSVFLALDILALVLHLVLEGAHWQMGPAYIGFLLLAAVYLLQPRHAAGSIAGASIVLVLVAAAGCFSAILPMFQLPRPTGAYAIGTRIFHLVDQSRPDPASPSGKRELMIQVWYPAAPSRHPWAPYRRRQETTLLSSYQSLIHTHARMDPPVAAGNQTFPVLLFNPSWSDRRTQNMFQVEDLTSHGFVVVGIDHTHNSTPVAFPGGRVVHYSPEPLMTDFDHSTIEEVNRIGAREIETETADDIFVLNQLEAMDQNPSSAFFGRLRVSDSGAFGHSFGGAVSAEVCARDPRVRAALDLDGSLFGSVQQTGLAKPFMLIEEVDPVYTREQLADSQADRIDNALNNSDTAAFNKFGGYRIFLRGSTHASFTDKPLYSPLPRLSGRGAIPPLSEFHILRAYSLAFFEQELEHKPSPLLNSDKSPFPEAEIVAFKPVPAR